MKSAKEMFEELGYELVFENEEVLRYRKNKNLDVEFWKVYEKMKEILDYNKTKQNKLEVKSEMVSIDLFDYKSNSRRYVQWSGADVLSHLEEDDNRKRWNTL